MSPLSLKLNYMIQKDVIRKLVEEKVAGTSIFVVDVLVKGGNMIRVFVDSPEGIKVEDCIAISRNIELGMDREVEDFELEVSSPGLDQSFRVKEQFLKNIGREVSVKDLEWKVVKGELLKVEDDGFVLMVREKRKLEGSKKKQVVEEEVAFKFADVKEVKVIISFK